MVSLVHEYSLTKYLCEFVLEQRVIGVTTEKHAEASLIEAIVTDKSVKTIELVSTFEKLFDWMVLPFFDFHPLFI